MGDADTTSELETECKDVAHSFGQAFQAKEFTRAMGLFAPDAQAAFVESLNSSGVEGWLSEDPTFVLRRCRRAVAALYGTIQSVTVPETMLHEEEITVVVELDCGETVTQLHVRCDETASIVDLQFPDTYSPPAYANEAAFEEDAVTIDCGDIELDGIATVPTEHNNPPIALLVPGAGDTDKDYTSGPNRFLKDLAWGLATEGIATLRYDKREAVTDIPADEQTLETRYFADGVKALETAAGITGVDSESVFVVGHSQGGRCGFEIARRYGDVAGVAALDSPVLKPLEQDAEHYREVLEVDGKLPDFADSLGERYEAERNRFFENDYEQGGSVMGIPVSLLDSTWAYDQFETAAALSTPLFIYQMDLELRAPEEKRNKWHEVISEERDTLIQRPQLNHCFQRGEQPGSLLGSVLFHRNADKVVINDLVTWINDTISNR